jgi:hypothetical protein
MTWPRQKESILEGSKPAKLDRVTNELLLGSTSSFRHDAKYFAYVHTHGQAVLEEAQALGYKRLQNKEFHVRWI